MPKSKPILSPDAKRLAAIDPKKWAGELGHAIYDAKAIAVRRGSMLARSAARLTAAHKAIGERDAIIATTEGERDRARAERQAAQNALAEATNQAPPAPRPYDNAEYTKRVDLAAHLLALHGDKLPLDAFKACGAVIAHFVTNCPRRH